MVIRHIGVGSLARILGALYALWGFIFGIIVALVALAGAGMSAASDSPMPGGWAALRRRRGHLPADLSTACSAHSAARSRR